MALLKSADSTGCTYLEFNIHVSWIAPHLFLTVAQEKNAGVYHTVAHDPVTSCASQASFFQNEGKPSVLLGIVRPCLGFIIGRG